MPSLPVMALPWLLLPGFALAPGRAPRLVAAGALLASLASASASLVLGSGTPQALAERAPALGVDAAYLTINAAILLAGAGLALVGAGIARRGGSLPIRLLAGLGAVAAAAVAWPLVRAGRPLVALLAALAVALLGWAWGGARSTMPTGTEVDASLAPWRRARGDLRLPLVLAALAMLVRDFGAALGLTAVLLGVLHWTMPRSRALDRVPVSLVAAVLTLAAAWVAWRTAGPDGLARSGLADAPFSPTLQRWLAAALLPVLLLLAGIPPFDRYVPGALLAPLAASFLGGALVPGFPEGLEHWRGIVAPWLVVAAADAVRRRRDPLLLSCAALFVGVVGGAGAAATAGLLLAVTASAADVLPLARAGWTPWAARGLLAVALVAWHLGLGEALGVEVVYSVAMTAVLLVGMLRGDAGATAPPPLATQ